MGLFARIRGKVEVWSPINPTELHEVPGIGTAAAYASGDAFGTRFAIKVPKQGVIATAIFIDHDNEGLTKELALFGLPFLGTADNAAFAPADVELSNAAGLIVWDTFFAFNANRLSIATPALYYRAPSGLLYCQFITRGADNIAAGKIPEFVLVIT